MFRRLGHLIPDQMPHLEMRMKTIIVEGERRSPPSLP